MNVPGDRDELLNAIEAELAEVGCYPTETARERMAGVLEQIDDLDGSVPSPGREELQQRLREMAQGAEGGLIRDAPPWLASADCV